MAAPRPQDKPGLDHHQEQMAREAAGKAMRIRDLVALTLLLGATAVAAEPARLLDPYARIRWRLELVDQEGLPLDAVASTVRIVAGARTASWHGFTAQLEGEGIVRAGPERYNDTLNGLTQFPVVADPSDLHLNQAVLRWNRPKVAALSVGREAVNYDNQRWIGSVDWRQNDQTLDIASAEVTAIPGVRLSYAHAWRVDRIFGHRSPQGVWRDNAIHLLHASYDAKALGTLTGYGYLLDIPDAPASSSASFGARLTGKRPLGKATFLYSAEVARQSDHGDNPKDYALTYLLLEPGISAGPVAARLGYERLGGNGEAALQTPLATLHAFNGWADKFLTTPPDGLRDLYLDVTVTPEAAGLPKGFALRTVLHDFRSTEGDSPYGREFDAQLLAPLRPNLSLLARFALYEARGFGSDTMKIWLQAEARF
jgi:hypothetical protein